MEGGPSAYLSWWERFVFAVIGIAITAPAVAAGMILRRIRWRPYATELVTDPKAICSILVVMLDHMGDLLISAGGLRDIRAHYPEAKITFVVRKSLVSAAQPCPYVDEILGFDLSAKPGVRALLGPFQAFAFAARHLWSREIDLVFNGRWDSDSCHGGLIGLYSLAPLHLGYSTRVGAVRRRVLNQRMERAFSHTYGSLQVIHEAARCGELLAVMGIPTGRPICEVWMTPADREFAETHLGELPGPLIALGLGASQRRRQWPLTRFRELSERISQRYPNSQFLVVGDRKDQQDAEMLRVSLGDRLHNFAGCCSVRESAALLSHCAIYVGADSGPMHLAAASGVGVVEQSCHPVNGASEHAYSPLRYHPVGVPYRVLRPKTFTPPCLNICSSRSPHCILAISVDETYSAVIELLEAPTAKAC